MVFSLLSEVFKKMSDQKTLTNRDCHLINVRACESSKKDKIEANLVIQTIMESDDITGCLFVKDLDLRFVLVNKCSHKLFNLPPSEVIGKTEYELLPKELAKRHTLEDLEIIKNGESVVREEECTIGNGERRWMSVIKIPIKDEDGKIVGILGLLRDITGSKQIERELREANEKYKLILDNIREGISVYEEFPDGTRKLLECNQRYVEMSGYSYEQLMKIGDTITVQKPFGDPKWISENTYTGNFSWVRPDGKENYIEYVANVVKVGNRKLIVGIDRDVTRRRYFEELLFAERDLGLSLSAVTEIKEAIELCLDTVIRISGMDCGGFYIVDEASGDLKLVHHRGLKHEFIEGVSYYSSETTHARLVKAGIPSYLEDIGRDTPNSLILSENLRSLAVLPITHEGKVIGCLNVHSHTIDKIPNFMRIELESIASRIGNVIARLKMQDAIKDSERKYRTLVENANEAIVIAQDGFIKYANPKALEMLGYSEEFVKSRPFVEFIHPDDREMVFSRYQKRISGEATYPIYSFRIIDKDGNTKWGEINGVRIEWEGRPATLNFIIDVTKRKLAEEEVRKLEKLRSIGILAGGIAHDFNNILTGILGNISLARASLDPDSKANERLRQAERACLQAKKLTHQLLTFSRGGDPVVKVTTIYDLVRDCTEFVLAGSKVNYELSIPEDIWPVMIDEEQIGQVINNVVLNAKESMPDGGTIYIWATNEEIPEDNPFSIMPGNYVKISIKDHGIGIPKEHIQRIFDPYFTTKPGGNGLGLTIAYSIVVKHKGHISVESIPGEGTTFHVYLPAAKEESPVRDREELSIKPGKGRVLVMDDEELIRDLANEILHMLGYEVSTAREGNEAVELYKQAKEFGNDFDAVIMDLTVPAGLGGREAVSKILEIDPNAKVIVSSGYSNDPTMSEYSKYGFKDVIKKPYNIEELSRVLSKVILDP